MRIIDFFDKGVSIYPDNLAFVEPGSEYTYAEAAAETHSIASAINGHGYLKGSRIGILAPNSNIAFLALLGLMRAESVWLPINPRNTVEANVDLLHRFEGELLFYHSGYEREAQAIKARVPGIKALVLLDGSEGAGTPLSDWIEGYQGDFCQWTGGSGRSIGPVPNGWYHRQTEERDDDPQGHRDDVRQLLGGVQLPRQYPPPGGGAP